MGCVAAQAGYMADEEVREGVKMRKKAMAGLSPKVLKGLLHVANSILVMV